jgi:hypothetical protein
MIAPIGLVEHSEAPPVSIAIFKYEGLHMMVSFEQWSIIGKERLFKRQEKLSPKEVEVLDWGLTCFLERDFRF